jgi:hypothetical protein
LPRGWSGLRARDEVCGALFFLDMERKYLYSNQESMFGVPDIVGYGKENFFIKEIGRDLANEIIIKNHYSHKYYNASYIHLGVFMAGALVGVLQYGYAMNPASQSGVVSGTEMDEYLELNRMWLDDCAPRNSESMAISYTIKYIKKRFPKIKWIQSFADERCGKFGIVYQAANFKYFGEHTSIFWTLDDIIYHNSLMTRDRKLSKSAAILQDGRDRATSEALRQFRYLYFIDKKFEKNALIEQCKYEKHYSVN